MPAASTSTAAPTALLNIAQEPNAAPPKYCARGVVNTLVKAGYGPIQRKDAKEMANVFASHPRFQEIKPSGQGRESVLSLPPGTIVVYQPRPGAKEGVTPRVTNKNKTATLGMATAGHTFIYLGNGKESSDTVRNVMPPEDYGSWRAFKPLNKGDTKSFTTVPVGKQSIMQTVGLESPTEATSSGATAPAFSTPAALPGASISGPITNPLDAAKGFDLSGAMKSFIGASADTLSQIPGLPTDMQEVLQKVKGMDSKDLMTASSQFHIQNPNWANESMGSDLTGLRMNKAEVTPKTVKPDAISTQSAKVESKPVSAPDAAPLPPSPAAQIEQSMSPLMQGITSVMNMPQQLMGAMSGGGQQPNTNSSGPNIDDLSLQLLQKLFIAD